METETTTTPRPATLGPTGMELRPEAPKGTGLSKRGGVLAILAVGALVALIIYGIFSRQSAAAGWAKRGGDPDKRVTGAKAAAKQFSSPPGNPVEDEIPKEELDPPPLAFMPRGAREGKGVRVNPAQVASRDTGRALQPGAVASGASNTVPAALRRDAGQSPGANYAMQHANGGGGNPGQGLPPYQPGGAAQPAGWDSPNAWGGSNGAPGHNAAAESAAAALARKQDREREAMDAATGINGAGGVRMPSAQGDVSELAGLVNSLGGNAGSAGPRAMPASNNVINGAPGPGRDPDDESGPSQDGKADFLRKARQKGGADNYVQSTRTRALSPFEIKAGWDIPGVLEQELNSDLPGEIRALVRENVYDTASGQYLLIPQGSRLVGRYDSRVAYAQNAVLVVWDRIIFPDASSIDIEGMSSQDVRGRSGLRDQVNHHYARLFGTAILSTAFSVSAVVAQNRRQNVFTLPSSQDVAASAAASEIARLGAAITRRNLNVQPTITIRAGYRFSVRVHKDLLFDAPYRPYPQGGERMASAN